MVKLSEILTYPLWIKKKYGGVPTMLSPEDREVTGSFKLRDGRILEAKIFAKAQKGMT